MTSLAALALPATSSSLKPSTSFFVVGIVKFGQAASPYCAGAGPQSMPVAEPLHTLTGVPVPSAFAMNTP